MTILQPAHAVRELLGLCTFLGAESRELAILGEGNVSVRTGEDAMLIKATGACLGSMSPPDLVPVRLSTLMGLVQSQEPAGDSEVEVALRDCLLDPADRRPSVEALLHAVSIAVAGAQVVAHTHPIAVNALLCSSHAEALVEGALFPDQIVVLGRHQLLVPYVDPGLPLARYVALRLREFIDRHGVPPKVIYLRNHGIFVLGESVEEVQRITRMTDKVARVLLGALSVGGVQYLETAAADRIDTRPDELLRREALAGRGPQPATVAGTPVR
jgi:rhamnose utilization protein RhaD (predicted bifunctional aldolase and dehydrogenase)